MDLDPSQLPPLRSVAPTHANGEAESLASGSLAPFSETSHVRSGPARAGGSAPPSPAVDSTSIDSQTRALMDGMLALGERETLGASAARLGALAAQVEDGSLPHDPYETALAMLRDEGL